MRSRRNCVFSALRYAKNPLPSTRTAAGASPLRLAFVRRLFYTGVIGSGGDAEPCALDRLGDRGHVGAGGQTHLAVLEIDGKGGGARARGGTRDGLYAAVAIHAGDLEDEFLSHVI